MRFGAQWDELRGGWSDSWIRVTLEDVESTDRAAQLLGPLQPFRAAPGVLTFRVSASGEPVKRLLERLDDERIHGSLEVLASDPAPARDGAPSREPALAEAWRLALETVPADWSDILAEVELHSSDWLERAAVRMTPINPRREGSSLTLRFRAARTFGYGASPEMVCRCLERCDEDGIRGSVRILRVISSTDPVQTQGPVWQLRGQTV